jgi:ribosome biogenesis ATPase
MALVKEAAALAVSRIFAQLEQAQGETGRPVSQTQGGTGHHVSAALGDTAVAGQGAARATPHAAPEDVPPLLPEGDVVMTDGAAQPDGALDAVFCQPAEAGDNGGGGSNSLVRFGGGPLTPAQLAGLAISMSDFEVAVGKVQPSVRREGFTTTPDVTWEDVGSLNEVRGRRASIGVGHWCRYVRAVWWYCYCVLRRD